MQSPFWNIRPTRHLLTKKCLTFCENMSQPLLEFRQLNTVLRRKVRTRANSRRVWCCFSSTPSLQDWLAMSRLSCPLKRLKSPTRKTWPFFFCFFFRKIWLLLFSKDLNIPVKSVEQKFSYLNFSKCWCAILRQATLL